MSRVTFLRVPFLVVVALTALSQRADVGAVVKKHAPELSGTILVTRNGQTLFHESYGVADRSFEIANTNATRYRIASITKLFTSVLALQLHEEGKLALDRPVSAYLPGCGDATIHQLLTHTSGLADVVALKSKEDAIRNGIELFQRPYTAEQIAAKYCAAPRAHDPGTKFFYNNGDYVLLGRVIEVLERAPFATVLQRRILQPLALRDTAMLAQQDIVRRLARPYFVRDDASGTLTHDMPVYDENWFAAGAMYSTSGDLQKFADALFGARLLKPATLARLTTPGLDEHAYGLWIYKDDIGGRTYTSAMRPGQIMGTNAVLYRVLEANLTIVILGNTDRANVDALAFAIAKALLSDPPETSAPRTPPAATRPAAKEQSEGSLSPQPGRGIGMEAHYQRQPPTSPQPMSPSGPTVQSRTLPVMFLPTAPGGSWM